jgi:hypothetical protein
VKAQRKPARAKKAPSRRGLTTIRRGMQWPFETDAQALAAWNRAVSSWNGGAA